MSWLTVLNLSATYPRANGGAPEQLRVSINEHVTAILIRKEDIYCSALNEIFMRGFCEREKAKKACLSHGMATAITTAMATAIRNSRSKEVRVFIN